MDWIQSDLSCSVEHAWITLRERLRSDCEKFKALEPRMGDHVRVSEEGDRLTITCGAYATAALWAVVAKGNRSISWKSCIAKTEQPTRQLFPTTTLKGECRILIDTQELEFWQASRAILKPVLFGCGF